MMTLLIYLVVGAIAGTVAGLFGVGGGVVIVPALVLAFTLQGMSPEVLTHLAVGTSLATIVITSLNSVRAHHAKQAVIWPIVASLAPGLCIGVFVGVHLAALIQGPHLQLAIGIFLLFIAAQMGFGLMPSGQRQLPSKGILASAGSVIGGISALFGIGGGSMTVPYLSFFNTPMQKAVATSSACGIPIALVGAGTNIMSGWQHEALPQWSTGFIYWPALIGLGLASAPFAKIGASLAHSLPPQKLKRIFALFLLFISVLMMIEGLSLMSQNELA